MQVFHHKNFVLHYDISGEFLEVEIEYLYNASFVFQSNHVNHLERIFESRDMARHCYTWKHDIFGEPVAYFVTFDISKLSENHNYYQALKAITRLMMETKIV